MKGAKILFLSLFLVLTLIVSVMAIPARPASAATPPQPPYWTTCPPWFLAPVSGSCVNATIENLPRPQNLPNGTIVIAEAPTWSIYFPDTPPPAGFPQERWVVVSTVTPPGNGVTYRLNLAFGKVWVGGPIPVFPNTVPALGVGLDLSCDYENGHARPWIAFSIPSQPILLTTYATFVNGWGDVVCP